MEVEPGVGCLGASACGHVYVLPDVHYSHASAPAPLCPSTPVSLTTDLGTVGGTERTDGSGPPRTSHHRPPGRWFGEGKDPGLHAPRFIPNPGSLSRWRGVGAPPPLLPVAYLGLSGCPVAPGTSAHRLPVLRVPSSMRGPHPAPRGARCSAPQRLSRGGLSAAATPQGPPRSTLAPQPAS